RNSDGKLESRPKARFGLRLKPLSGSRAAWWTPVRAASAPPTRTHLFPRANGCGSAIALARDMPWSCGTRSSAAESRAVFSSSTPPNSPKRQRAGTRVNQCCHVGHKGHKDVHAELLRAVHFTEPKLV